MVRVMGEDMQRMKLFTIWLIVMGSLMGSVLPVSLGQSVSAQTTAESSTSTDEFGPLPADVVQQVTALLQEADAHFQQQELGASYDLYLRVLGLDPLNQVAHEHLISILQTYKTTLAQAPQNAADDQIKRQYQQYRDSVRDFLQVLTTHLKRGIQRYGELVAPGKAGQTIKPEIFTVLQVIIQTLEALKQVYQDFPQGEQDAASTQKIIDRLSENIKKYKQEQLAYQ
jgi:hypothetical protein